MNNNGPSENIIFVDTSALLGIFNRTDQYHEEAEMVYKELKEKGKKLIISNYIVAEAHAGLINRTKDPTKGFELLYTLYDPSEFNVVFVESDIEEEARDEIRNYNDKVWSISDMASFLIMEKLNLQYYFSFDGDFQQNGNFQDIRNYI